jgi:hypothetical protein
MPVSTVYRIREYVSRAANVHRAASTRQSVLLTHPGHGELMFLHFAEGCKRPLSNISR